MYKCWYVFIILFIKIYDSKLYAFQKMDLGKIESYISLAKDRRINKIKRTKNLEIAYKIAANLDSDTTKTRIFSEISIAYYLLSDFDSFKKVNHETLQLAIENKDSLILANCYKNFGMRYLKISKNDSAYYNSYEANKIYEKLSEKVLQARVLLNMAIAQKNVKDYIGSEVTTIKGLNLLDGSEEYKIFFSLFNNLGIISTEKKLIK